SLDKLITLATGTDPALRREAATALGRLGRPEGVAALLDGLRTPADRFVEHAQVFALIQIADQLATREGLSDQSANVRRGALIALAQMRGGNLPPELVPPLLDPSEPALEETAIRIMASRPAWSRHFVEVVRPWLARKQLAERDRKILQGVLPRIAGEPAIQD